MKRLLNLLGIVTLGIALLSVGYIAATQRQAVPFDGFKLIRASQAYAQQLRDRGAPIPATVSSTELIQHGFLTATDLEGLGNAEITFNLGTDESRPQDTLMQARLPDGREIVALADGSVQEKRR